MHTFDLAAFKALVRRSCFIYVACGCGLVRVSPEAVLSELDRGAYSVDYRAFNDGHGLVLYIKSFE